MSGTLTDDAKAVVWGAIIAGGIVWWILYHWRKGGGNGR